MKSRIFYRIFHRCISNNVSTRSLLHKDWKFPKKNGSDRKSTRLNSSHVRISYAVFCLKKKKTPYPAHRMTPPGPPVSHPPPFMLPLGTDLTIGTTSLRRLPARDPRPH